MTATHAKAAKTTIDRKARKARRAVWQPSAPRLLCGLCVLCGQSSFKRRRRTSYGRGYDIH